MRESNRRVGPAEDVVGDAHEVRRDEWRVRNNWRNQAEGGISGASGITDWGNALAIGMIHPDVAAVECSEQSRNFRRGVTFREHRRDFGAL